jgi:hypothetical protein
LAEARSQGANRPPLETGGPRRVYGAGATAPAALESEGSGADPAARGVEAAGVDGGAPCDEEGPPLEVIAGDESSESSGVAARSVPIRPRDEDETLPTPPLGELSGRVPTVLQEAMEELFRARFVRVARVPVAAPKTAS